jgi:hypothetical protein
MKNILIQFSIKKMNSTQYDQIIADLKAVGQGDIPDRLYHVSAPKGEGWHVTDVWSSEEAFNKFADVMVPIMVKNGVEPAEPMILPIHNIIQAQ